MSEPGLIISILLIAITAYLLVKKFNPQAVLLFAGILMMIIASLLSYHVTPVAKPTGFFVFDLFKRLQESLSDKTANVGLMIMTIGGFVAYMKAIGASDALVHVAVKPLGIFKKYPYLAASIVIPIGQVLFICTPSATGLGLLLVASFFPILVSLGVSRVSAVSVISACTVFDMGPASANTARASQLLDMHNVEYFIKYQLPLVIPMTILLMVVYFFVNKHYDKKLPKEQHVDYNPDEIVLKTPLIYSILPILPLLLLVLFSPILNIFSTAVHLDTTTAMLISLVFTMILEIVRLRNVKEVFASLKIFWEGMGEVFASVVTLIVCAEIFANGLISLGFIDSLTNISMSLGLGIVGIGILMTVIIFLASVLMGSGNASFFSFSPLVPGIAAKFNISAAGIILPMQLSSSMGRAVSPIAGVIVGVAKIAGVQPMDLAKRNMIPMSVGLLFMLVFHYFI